MKRSPRSMSSSTRCRNSHSGPSKKNMSEKPEGKIAMLDAIPMRRTVLKAAAGLGALGLGTILTHPREARAAPAGFVLPPPSEAVTPFRGGFPQDAFPDLKRRLSVTRWPERE